MKSFGIIPAAGRSQRMGAPKLLLPWRAKTVIEQVIAAWQASRVTRVVVVVRPGDAELAKLIESLDVDRVVPDVPPPEMRDSVCLALAHVERRYVPSPEDAWLLAPADMPGLSPAVINLLLAEYAHTSPTRKRGMAKCVSSSPEVRDLAGEEDFACSRVEDNPRSRVGLMSSILIPTYGEKRGHPVLFPWSLAADATSLPVGEGLNALVARHPARLVPCAEPAVLEDLDTPDDYRRLQNACP